MSSGKTSASHPLRIDTVTPPGTTGAIGMTLCPGHRGSSLAGGRWQRDLDADLAVIEAWHPALAITLMEAHEFATIGIPGFDARVRTSSVPWRFAPIVDGGVPDRGFEAAWQDLGTSARERLAAGERVLLHCRGGLGRTGLVAAMLLMDFGATAAEATASVRAARPGTIETSAQEQYLAAYVRFRGLA